MDISIENKDGICLVKIDGRLDTTNYGELEAALGKQFDGKEHNFLLDLEKLDYISSSGLRILLMYLKKIKAVNGRFMLCNMNPEIKEIFEISGFINIFEIYDDLESALKS